MSLFPYKFCLITDFRYIPDQRFENIIGRVIDGGVDLIQFRNEEAPENLKLSRAKRIRDITKTRRAGYIVNSDIDIAVKTGAEGIQVKAQDIQKIPGIKRAVGPGKCFGVSVHNENEILKAEVNGADFLILSPLFQPGSKSFSHTPLGINEFSRLCTLTKTPILALGGINSGNANLPMMNGAHGVAVISGLLKSDDIFQEAQKIYEKIL